MSAAAPRAETLPVILLHGWGMHGGVWADLVTRLGGSVSALAPDLPGHGHSPMVEPYDIDALVDQIAGAAPARCTVAGWSLGGQLALAWARRHPQQVERLVLIGTTPCFVSAPDWPHGVAEEVFAQFATDLTADAARTLRRFLLLETRGDAEARAVARQLDDALAARPLPGREVLAQTLLWLQSTDLRTTLAEVMQPALILHGDRDQLAPPAAGAYLASGLPHGRLEMIAGAAHAPFISAPQAVCSLMTAFCNER